MKVTVTAFFVALCLCYAVDAHLIAQPENLQFEYLQQGLPKTGINCILQDREGFMWFGTEDGLYKYDGHKATAYQADPANPEHTLRSNYIKAIHEDQKGRLWLDTYEGGLHQVDKRTGKVTAYPIDSNQGNGWNSLYYSTIFEDEQGVLWLGSSLGIVSFDPATEKYSLYPSPNGQLHSFMADERGILWVLSDSEGIYRFDPATGKFTFFPVSTLDFTFTRVYPDKKGNVWIGTYEDGLFLMDTRTPGLLKPYNPGGLIKNTILNFYEADGLWLATGEGLQHIDISKDHVTTYQSDPSQPGSLNNNTILSVYKDRTGNLWVGTSTGVNKASTRTKLFYTYQITPTPASFHRPENEIYFVLEDHTGTVWVGSAAKGLYRLDAQTQQFNPVVVNPNDKRTMMHGQMFPLVEDQQGQLWVGTDMEQGLYRLDRTTGKFIRYPCAFFVRTLDVDASGKLWVGGFFDEMASFDPATEQFTYYKTNEKDSTSLIPGIVNDLMVSRTGEVWVATSSGMSRFIPKTGKFTRYQPNPEVPKGHLNDHYVNYIYEDQEGMIWIGTLQGGLNRFDPHTNTFTYFTTLHGLPSNNILSIIEDEKSNLWMGTSQGLSRFNSKTHTFRNFNVSDGLPGNIFYGGGSVFSRNGKLFFGNMDGLVSFYPDSIKENTTVPLVYITGFKVLEKDRALPTTNIELPYDENFLSFDFVALNYDAPEKNQYAYKLEDLDKDWVYSGTRRFASYTDLAPGQYVFRVKAAIGDGIWNEEGASLSLTILPPWWQTWWAYALYGLLALGILISIRHYEIKRFKLRQRATYLSELDTLKSRFFANISHEFRTPLTLILGPVKNLIEKQTNRHDQDSLTGIQRNAQRLLHLVNQLLDLAKLEAGKLKLEAMKSDIVGFLKARAYAFSSLADHKNIHFVVELPEEKIGAYFDRDKLEKIVNNLLSNAFKFTHEGGLVTLKGQAVTQGNKAWFQIQVADSGKGIPAGEIDKIYDRFYQVDASLTREQEGTGIGLALTKELVELHHGIIQVESIPGQGTTFTLLLPLGKAHLKEEEIIQELPLPKEATGEERIHPSELLSHLSDNPLEKEESKQKEVEKPVVLIVEDHQEVRRFIRESISDHYQVQEAANGLKGLEMAQELIPDLIISDVMMPEMDGLSLCEKIKTDELTSHIPVILLTAKADRQSKLTGLETGADDYLSKPFDAEELQLIIRNRIEERRKMWERFSRDITLEPRDISITSLDEKFLTKVMDIIEEHMDDESFSIEDLSKEAGYSQVQFYRKIKALSDQSPSQFLRTIRLKRAAAMLQHKSDTISQIAYAVGFNNLSYFNKCFKEQFGMTPGQYAAADQEVK